MSQSDQGDASQLAVARATAAASLALSVAGALVVIAVGTLRFAQNATLWMDEAGVAISLLELSPVELFGRLIGGYSFPRPVLLVIAGLERAIGFEPWVLRALPFAAFVVATVLWVGLLWRRFRAAPWILALGLALLAIPSSWPVYGAMFKQYSVDVLVALLPFCLGDRFYEETLRGGRRPARLFALAIPCALSFTYAFALLGRVVGFWVGGLAQRGAAIDRRGLAWGVAGVAVFTASLVVTDLRHTAGESSLYGFWQSCLIDESVSKAARSIEFFAFGWYFGHLEFVPVRGLPWTIHFVLRGAFALGALGLAVGIFRPGSQAAAARDDDWGTRSLGAAAMLCGFLIAATLAAYPVCPGRLTLFALFALQLVTLEGLDLARRGVGRLPGGGIGATLLGVALVAAVLPTSWRAVVATATAAPPENFRPLLDAVAARPGLPVLATPCSTKQVQTVPEWLLESPVVAWNSWPERGGEQVWVLNVKRSTHCQSFAERVAGQAASWEAFHDDDDSAELYLATLVDEPVWRPAPPSPAPRRKGRGQRAWPQAR